MPKTRFGLSCEPSGQSAGELVRFRAGARCGETDPVHYRVCAWCFWPTYSKAGVRPAPEPRPTAQSIEQIRAMQHLQPLCRTPDSLDRPRRTDTIVGHAKNGGKTIPAFYFLNQREKWVGWPVDLVKVTAIDLQAKRKLYE
jgi:hypothetical protein